MRGLQITQEFDESDLSCPDDLPTHDLQPVASPRRSRFGEYDVVAPLARGGTGGVYLAIHAPTGRRVALKVLDAKFARYEDLAERLCAEAELASRASHPNVVEIHAAAYVDDGAPNDARTPYLVMEYLDGESLAAICDRGDVDLGFAIRASAQAASALAALHAGGVIHCDVKLDNILVVQATGAVKVVDFGVSRLIDDATPLESIAGTPASMAPEQWRCEPVPASDVYSLGCVMFELLTGSPLFDGSLPEIMMAHLEQRPARPSWLRAMPQALERLILRALAKDPHDRPTMAEMADELALLADQHAPARSTARGSDPGISLSQFAV